MGTDECADLLSSMQDYVHFGTSTVVSLTEPAGQPGYLGTPPAEVEEAYRHLKMAFKGSDQYVPFSCPGKDCVEKASMFLLGWEMIRDVFPEWEPWL